VTLRRAFKPKTFSTSGPDLVTFDVPQTHRSRPVGWAVRDQQQSFDIDDVRPSSVLLLLVWLVWLVHAPYEPRKAYRL
jgi:hypothetical protein